MFRLLTEETEEKVAKEYVMRRAIIMLCAFIIVLVVGVIGLLPSYVLSDARQNEVLERARIINSSGARGDELDLQTWLIETNRKLKTLSPTLDTDRPSDFIQKVLDLKIPGVRVTDLSWIKTKNKIALSVDGIASDRQALITFEDRIKSSVYFVEVTFPISNLAKDSNINFQIKFALATSTAALKKI